MKQKPLHFTAGQVTGGIARFILTAVARGATVPFEYNSSRKLFRISRMGGDFFFSKSDFQREVNRLKKNGYVSLKKSEPAWYVQLLPKGDKKRQAALLNDLRLPKTKLWDGKWRVFFFDIPENKKSARDQLRRKLKELGMFNFQRSVFAYPYDCRKELETVYRHFGVEKHVTYLVTGNIDINRELRKHFGL
jgi:DNA-binding transcriptional regulator PaaX